MRFFGWFGSLTLFWILIELSFFEMLFPEVKAPLILIALVLALSVMLEQRIAFWWAAGAVVVFDVLRSGGVTLLSPFFACVAYGAYFLSQRFLFAREHTNRFLLSLLVVGITVVYETVFPLFSWPNFIDIFLAVPIWFVVSWSVERLQAWVIATSFSEFRGMRHS